MQYKVIYKDGPSQIIDAASYNLDGGLYIFREEDGEIASRIIFGEVRSITKLKESPVGFA